MPYPKIRNLFAVKVSAGLVKSIRSVTPTETSRVHVYAQALVPPRQQADDASFAPRALTWIKAWGRGGTTLALLTADPLVFPRLLRSVDC
jgi:hypothetical protein